MMLPTWELEPNIPTPLERCPCPVPKPLCDNIGFDKLSCCCLYGRCHLELELETFASNEILEKIGNKLVDGNKSTTRDLDFE